MKKTLITLTLLGLSCSRGIAGTADQVAVRSQIERFWGVAGTQLAERPAVVATETPAPVITPLPAAHGAWPTAGCTPVIVQPAPRIVQSPRPDVHASQHADSGSSHKNLGLSLFGGLRLFDISWSDEHEGSRDDLQGDL